jgi:hypothetical protein
MAWYNEDWRFRKKLTIQASRVQGSHSNFPVLINHEDLDLVGKARSDGHDILFTSSDGETKLDHDLESYTPSFGRITAWLKVPSVSSGSNTVIYMYYCNPSASDQSNPVPVWSSYEAVWHMGSDLSDVSANGWDGTNFGALEVQGKIGNARDFNGSSDYIYLPEGAIVDNKFTYEAWIRPDSDITNYCRSIIQGSTVSPNHQLTVLWHTDHIEVRYETDGSVGDPQEATATVTNDGVTWTHFAWCCNDGTSVLYINGAVSSGAVVGAGLGIQGANLMGSRQMYRNFWNGGIDEVRLTKGLRCLDWIKTEYNNQSSPTTFYTISSEELETMATDELWLNDNQVKIGAGKVFGEYGTKMLIPAPHYYIDRVNLTWLSVTQVQIGTGHAWDYNNNELIKLTTPVTVDITVNGAGGLDATSSEQASTWYYVYVISDSTSGSVAGLLSESSTTPILPSGYDLYRRVGAVRNNSSSNLLRFKQWGEGVYKTYLWEEDIITGDLFVLDNGIDLAATTIDCTPGIPSTSTLGYFKLRVWADDADDLSSNFRPKGITSYPVIIQTTKNDIWYTNYFWMGTDTTQKIEYYVDDAKIHDYLSVAGFQEFLS